MCGVCRQLTAPQVIVPLLIDVEWALAALGNERRLNKKDTEESLKAFGACDAHWQ